MRRNRSHVQLDYDEAAYEDPLTLGGGADAGAQQERLCVVANRLPVTCTKDPQGHWQLQVRAPQPGGRPAANCQLRRDDPSSPGLHPPSFKPARAQVSAGGLVSALKGVSTYKTVWIGWPGARAPFTIAAARQGTRGRARAWAPSKPSPCVCLRRWALQAFGSSRARRGTS